MSNLLKYKKFLHNPVNEGVVKEEGDENINKFIDQAYQYFKTLKKPINTKDIIDYVEKLIGKELDDDDYIDLYYKITGEYLDADVIEDLDDEEKFIIKD